MKVKGIENKVTLEFVAVFHRVTNLIVSANASGKAVPLSMLQVVCYIASLIRLRERVLSSSFSLGGLYSIIRFL